MLRGYPEKGGHKRKKAKVDFDAWREKSSLLAEESIAAFLDSFATPPERFSGRNLNKLLEAVKYTALGGGKRLRALLALASAEAAGGDESQAIPAAVAVELVHAYSLIHDDLPALDNDDTRRGRPASHIAFGEATAILAGDLLQAMAYKALVSIETPVRALIEDRFAAVYVLSSLSGLIGLVGGQYLDLELEKQESANFSDVLEMEDLKTGNLFGAAMVMGGILGGANENERVTLLEAGKSAGIAFQIRDDLLNLSGNPALMGKSVGTDAKRGKASAVAAIGANEAEETADNYIQNAIERIRPLGSEKLEQLLRLMVRRDR